MSAFCSKRLGSDCGKTITHSNVANHRRYGHNIRVYHRRMRASISPRRRAGSSYRKLSFNILEERHRG